jgi:hypothetical protein
MAFNYSPKIVTDGLVLYLDAANTKSYVSGSTSWNDISRGGNNGTLVNGPTFSSSYGGSIVFDGVDDRLTFNSAFTISAAQDWTIQTWIESFQTSPSSQYIRFLGANDTDRNFFFFEWNNRIFARNNTASGFAFQTGFSPALPLDRSTFLLTLIGRSGNLELYYNNTITSVNVPITGSLNFTDVMNDRRVSSPGGKLNIFQIYNRALSALEITQNYNATKGRYGL